MVNETEKSDAAAEWKMPDPVFRSSDGHDLRAETDGANVVGHEDITESPEPKMENKTNNIADHADDPQAAEAIRKEARGDKLGLSMTFIGLLAVLAAALIFLLFYFLFFRQNIPDAQ